MALPCKLDRQGKPCQAPANNTNVEGGGLVLRTWRSIILVFDRKS